MTLATQRATAIMFVDGVIVRGPCVRRSSGFPSPVVPRFLRRMVRTVPRSDAVHLTFRRSDESLRNLPLQTDRELKRQQRCNYPVSEAVTHDLQRTLLGEVREEAGIWREFQRTDKVQRVLRGSALAHLWSNSDAAGFSHRGARRLTSCRPLIRDRHRTVETDLKGPPSPASRPAFPERSNLSHRVARAADA
jgi:hypothetical protein